MNFLEGIVKKKGDHYQLELPKLKTDLTFDSKKELLNGKSELEVLLGVRPTDVTILNKETPNSLKGKLAIVEPISSNYEVTIALSDKSTFKIKTKKNYEDFLDKDVWIAINSEKMYLFLPQDGKAIYHGGNF